MFRIKICGVTNVPDATAAADAGANALGLNFFHKSERYVSAQVASSIAHEIHPSTSSHRSVAVVGVFVNHSYDEIFAIASKMFLSGVQFHGDEPPELLARFPKRRPMTLGWWGLTRARRMDDRGVAAIAEDCAECAHAGRRPDAVLVDAMTPGRYGGTGETVSWVGLADHKMWLGDTPLILAGGLTPDNVAEAIRIVRPHGVDVASGVESAPGKKDPYKVRDFIAAARAAFGE